jgi:thiamine-phosphate pyrophosphorylase
MTRFDISKARLYAILDSAYVPFERWIPVYQALVAGGADLIQLRAKSETSRKRIALLDAVLPDYVTSNVPLIINDDIELARRYPGMNLGVHLGQDDTPIEVARELLGSNAIIGTSTHSLDQAEAAVDKRRYLDYFAVGPLFATPTKPDYEPVGLELIGRVNALNAPLPFFCIGGVNRQNLSTVVAQGARRVVVVSDILRAEDPAEVVRELKAGLPEE